MVHNRKWNRTLAVRSHKLGQVRSHKLGQLERTRRQGLLHTRKAAVDGGTLLGLQVHTSAPHPDLATETEGPQMSANNHRIGTPAAEERHESTYSPLRILVEHCVEQTRVVVAVRAVLGRRAVQSGVVVAVQSGVVVAVRAGLRLPAACKGSAEVPAHL